MFAIGSWHISHNAPSSEFNVQVLGLSYWLCKLESTCILASNQDTFWDMHKWSVRYGTNPLSFHCVLPAIAKITATSVWDINSDSYVGLYITFVS